VIIGEFIATNKTDRFKTIGVSSGGESRDVVRIRAAKAEELFVAVLLGKIEVQLKLVPFIALNLWVVEVIALYPNLNPCVFEAVGLAVV
jgi:hypothetical protein